MFNMSIYNLHERSIVWFRHLAKSKGESTETPGIHCPNLESELALEDMKYILVSDVQICMERELPRAVRICYYIVNEPKSLFKKVQFNILQDPTLRKVSVQKCVH